MITIDDLKTAGVEEAKATHALELLGDAVKKLIPDRDLNKILGEIDGTILMLTKVPKLSDGTERTIDYAKRAPSEWLKNEVSVRTTEINNQLASLKEELKNHKGDETLKEKIKLLEEEKAKFPDLVNEKVKEFKTKAEKAEADLDGFKKDSVLKSSIPVKFKSELPKKYVDFEIQQALTEAKTKFTKQETGSDSKLYLINEVTYDKVEANAWFSERLKDIVDTGHTQTGGGAGESKPNLNGELVLPKDMPKGEKYAKIEEYLIKNGISKLDPMWDGKFKELAVKNELIVEKSNKPATA